MIFFFSCHRLVCLCSQRILYNFNEIGKRPPTFGDASSIADAALQSGYNFGTGSVLYNHFKSAIAYETTSLPLYSFEQLAESPELVKYELEDDIIQNFQEFHLAVSVYYAMMEVRLCVATAECRTDLCVVRELRVN